ncbi:glycosyltransferase [Parageobacillus thermoglucosidasius]|nr:glycosyltransferase [Symbiobacterium thermophilum]
MKDKPLVSVIMPVFNCAKFLDQAIESVLNQSFSNFELIIVNDGSTDNTLNVIEKYMKKDNRITLISRENKGLVYSLNEAIRISNGDLIARMDGDDICLPNRLLRQVQFMRENKQIDILGSQVSVFGDISMSERERLEEKLNTKISDNNAEEQILTNWYCLAHSSIIFRKSVIKNIGYYEDCKSEDLELWLRAIRNGLKISKINEVLIRYRVHRKSKSTLDNINYEGIKEAILLKVRHVFLRKNNVKKYLIWGTGNGGDISYEIITKELKDSMCVGFIDSFKNGKFKGKNIYKPVDIKDIDFDYIFIATDPGKKQAIKFLDSLGLQNLNDYLCTI